MKRILIAGCVAIAAMAAFAETNQVASAAQGKEDARAEARREREAHIDAQPIMEDVFVRQIKFAKAQDIMRALSILTMESTKEAGMAATRQDSQEKIAMLKKCIVLA